MYSRTERAAHDSEKSESAWSRGFLFLPEHIRLHNLKRLFISFILFRSRICKIQGVPREFNHYASLSRDNGDNRILFFFFFFEDSLR